MIESTSLVPAFLTVIGLAAVNILECYYANTIDDKWVIQAEELWRCPRSLSKQLAVTLARCDHVLLLAGYTNHRHW